MAVDVASSRTYSARRFTAGGSAALPLGLILALVVAVRVSVPLPDDVAWLLTVCDRLLDGQRLYIDIAEPNPPMSAWLYLPWVWLARTIGVSPEAVVSAAAVGFCAVVIALSGRIVEQAGLAARRAWLIAAAIALVLAPVSTFAQREFFAVAAVLPMLATISATASGQRPSLSSALAAGALAGLCMAIKPHFALAIVLPLGFAVWRRRSLAPLFVAENVAAAVALGVYVAAFLFAYGDYFSTMLPIAQSIYLPNRLGLAELASRPGVLNAAMIFFALYLLRRQYAGRPLMIVLALAAAGFAIAYFVQGKGRHYHALPALTLATLAFTLALLAARNDAPRLVKAALACLAVVIAVGPAAEFIQWRSANEPLREALAELGPGLKIGVISDHLQLANPVHRMVGGKLVNRTPSLWIVGNAFERCATGADDALKRICADAEDRERVMLREDFLRTPPDVILTERQGFDWLAWARDDPALAAFLANYHSLKTVEMKQLAMSPEVLVRNAAR